MLQKFLKIYHNHVKLSTLFWILKKVLIIKERQGEEFRYYDLYKERRLMIQISFVIPFFQKRFFMLQGYLNQDKKDKNNRPESEKTENSRFCNLSCFFYLCRVIDYFGLFLFIFFFDDFDFYCFSFLFIPKTALHVKRPKDRWNETGEKVKRKRIQSIKDFFNMLIK